MTERTKRKHNESRRKTAGNPWGHYRKQPSVEEFAACFTTVGGVAVLREHCNDTASWVQRFFPSVEWEVHQVGTFVRAMRQKKEEPDYDVVRQNCPRLAIVATDVELKQIESGGNPKDVAASILCRILDRRESSIRRWAQGKK